MSKSMVLPENDPITTPITMNHHSNVPFSDEVCVWWFIVMEVVMGSFSGKTMDLDMKVWFSVRIQKVRGLESI